MASARTAVLLAAALALAAPPVPADEAADAVAALQFLLQGVTGDLIAAVDRISAADRTGAGDEILEAAAKGVALREQAESPGIAGSLGRDADRVVRAAAALSGALARASARAADVRKSDAAVLRAVKGASFKATRLEGSFRDAPSLGPIVILEEVRARSAGFHRPGQVVTFRPRVYPRGSCVSPMSMTVIDTAAVHGKTSVLDTGIFPVEAEEPFELTMGPDAGAARVMLQGCGRTCVRLLCNYGQKPGGGGGGGSGNELWGFSLTGSDEFVLGGFPYPTYMESWWTDIVFHGDLVKSLGQSIPDPTGTGSWWGIETPLLQQPEPSIVRLLEFEDIVPVTLEVWWSTTEPSLHIRSDFPLIAHRFRWTYTGVEDSIPVQAVWLDVDAAAPGHLAGTWYTVGGGSMSGNSSSGTWTATKR